MSGLILSTMEHVVRFHKHMYTNLNTYNNITAIINLRFPQITILLCLLIACHKILYTAASHNEIVTGRKQTQLIIAKNKKLSGSP